MATDYKKILAESEVEIRELARKLDDARRKGTPEDMARLKVQIQMALTDYQSDKEASIFAELAAADRPIEAAVRRLSFDTLKVSEVKDNDGRVINYEVGTKAVPIDLEKLCRKMGYRHLWVYKVEKLAYLLTIREAKKAGESKAKISEITEKYKMSEEAKRLNLDETTVSDTALCKVFQMIVDELFEADGKSSGGHKVTKYDVNYLDACFTKEGKKPGSITVAPPRTVIRLIANAMHVNILNKGYDIDYQKIAEKKQEAESAPEKAQSGKPADNATEAQKTED